MTQEEFQAQLSKLIKNYKPSPDVVARIKYVTLLMVVGPSGVGKSSLIRRSGLAFVPSDTTRDPRPGEQNGVDFYFRHDLERVIEEIKTGRFVQVAIGPSGDFYATKDTAYPTSGAATMPIVADVIPIFRKLGFKETTTAFVTPPSYSEWMRRMSVHPVIENQRVKRLAEARRSFEFALSDKQTHFILNDNLESAVDQLKNLLNNEVDKQREKQARESAKVILKQIT
jgi:guanylate kinase